MRHLHMSKEMRARMRAYYELCFPGRAMFDENSIVSSLSHPLRSEIALHKCQGVLECLRVVREPRLSRAIASLLERMVFIHGDYVIYAGQ